MKKRIIAFLSAVLAAATAFGCWYKFYGYEDYIYAVNNRKIHTTEVLVTGNSPTRYKTENNLVVDFPVSVSLKLVSNSKVLERLSFEKQMITSCALQYRVLPNGDWVTVQKYEVPAGTISGDYPPNFFLGRNNIYPKCKKGDVVMIRVYITDGIWQSGDLSSMCTNQLVHVEGVKTPTLPNQMIFSITGNNTKSVDLGGNWTPNLVTTIIWSGNTRTEK